MQIQCSISNNQQKLSDLVGNSLMKESSSNATAAWLSRGDRLLMEAVSFEPQNARHMLMHVTRSQPTDKRFFTRPPKTGMQGRSYVLVQHQMRRSATLSG